MSTAAASRLVARWVIALLVAVPLAALAWGFFAGQQPVGTRPATIVMPADAAWRAALPLDPASATKAYLARIPAETRARANALAETAHLSLMLRILVIVASTLLVMSTRLASRMRAIAYRVSSHGWLQDATFALLLLVVLLLLELPIDVFAQFVRWREAGLSRVTFGGWLGDFLIQWAVIAPFYIVGLVVFMALIRRRPTTWPLWASIVYVVLYATYVLVSPLYIEPLLNTYTPLADGATRNAVLSLARANGVSADQVYVKDASRQSVILNAQVTGIGGTARITLDDNSIAATPREEIEFVMAHEIGHYVLRHIPKGIVFAGLVMAAGFVLIAWALRRLVAWRGGHWSLEGAGNVAAMPLLWLLISLWGYVSLPISNAISREQETEADIFGLNASRAPFGLADFMLHDADAQPAEPGALVEWALYNHPSAAHRIEMAMRWRAEHAKADAPATASSRAP